MVVIPSQRQVDTLDREHVFAVLFCAVMGIIGAYRLGQTNATFTATILVVATVAYGIGLVYNLSWLMTKREHLQTVKVARRS